MENVVDRSRVGFWVLIGVLAVSGISMAFIAIFGLFDSIAFSMVWRVFVADVYLIAALAAQHNWLRWTAWIGTGVTFLIGIWNIFRHVGPEPEWNEDYVYGDQSTGWSPWEGFDYDIEISAHMILGTILLLGFISLAYRWIAGERLVRAVYVFTFVTGLVSAVLGAMLVLDSPHRWNFGSWLGQLAAGLVILALTGAAIVIIAGFVQRKAARAREASVQSVGVAVLSDAERFSMPREDVHLDGMSPDELRQMVRAYVDEYLRERNE